MSLTEEFVQGFEVRNVHKRDPYQGASYSHKSKLKMFRQSKKIKEEVQRNLTCTGTNAVMDAFDDIICDLATMLETVTGD